MTKFKLDSNKIILGSGSDQILELICKAFLKKGDDVIVPKYSFLIYRLYSKMNGAKVLYSNEKNFTVSVSDILKKVTKKTKIVFIANPNNPTGTFIEKKKLLLLRKICGLHGAYCFYVIKHIVVMVLHGGRGGEASWGGGSYGAGKSPHLRPDITWTLNIHAGLYDKMSFDDYVGTNKPFDVDENLHLNYSKNH